MQVSSGYDINSELCQKTFSNIKKHSQENLLLYFWLKGHKKQPKVPFSSFGSFEPICAQIQIFPKFKNDSETWQISYGIKTYFRLDLIVQFWQKDSQLPNLI